MNGLARTRVRERSQIEVLKMAVPFATHAADFVTETEVESKFPARFPVIANATARPVDRREDALALLADQLTAPVRWVECMRTAAEFAPDATFIEIGPGSVLSGLLKRILPGAKTVTLGTAAELEAFLA